MTAFDPLRLDQQPPWLRELRQVIVVYPVDPGTDTGAALCRWCDMTWPLPLARLEADPLARAGWMAGVAQHGLQHAAAGELRLDFFGEPLNPVAEEDEVRWPN